MVAASYAHTVGDKTLFLRGFPRKNGSSSGALGRRSPRTYAADLGGELGLDGLDLRVVGGFEFDRGLQLLGTDAHRLEHRVLWPRAALRLTFLLAFTALVPACGSSDRGGDNAWSTESQEKYRPLRQTEALNGPTRAEQAAAQTAFLGG